MSSFDTVIMGLEDFLRQMKGKPKTERRKELRREAEKLLKQTKEIRDIILEIKQSLNGNGKINEDS